jgi:hypothetical protein
VASLSFPLESHGTLFAFCPRVESPLTQQACPFEPVQHRIEGPGTQVVSVLAQILDHAKTENRTFACVIQQVNSN